MRLICALLFTFLGAFANAQQLPDPTLVQAGTESDRSYGKETYFLIDASGSMAGKDAEAKVSEILERIAEDDASAPVSRTYFRAEDGAACWRPIEIGPMQAAAESTPKHISYQNDFTPMGEALKAALLRANERGRAADIIIISDEDPTPGCGIDVCTVAEAYLPLKDVEVTSIQVDPVVTARRDTLGCIVAAQHRPSEGPFSTFSGDKQIEAVAPDTELNAWESASLLARWHWFIILILATSGFVIFSLRYGERIKQYNEEIVRIQKLRRAADLGSREIENDQSVGFFEPSENSPRFKLAWQICLWTSGILAFILLFLPICSYIQEAQGAAWFVLSSGFANAFAILATTPALFAAGQYWIYDQSKRTYYLVSDSADDERRRQARERAEQLLKNFQALRDSLDKIQFSAPWSYRMFVSRRHHEVTEADRANLKAAQQRIIEVAKGDLLTDPFSPQITRETDRLKSLLKDWTGFLSNSNLAEFIEQLDASKPLPADSRENWLSFARSIRSRDNKIISKKLAALIEPNEP